MYETLRFRAEKYSRLKTQMRETEECGQNNRKTGDCKKHHEHCNEQLSFPDSSWTNSNHWIAWNQETLISVGRPSNFRVITMGDSMEASHCV